MNESSFVVKPVRHWRAAAKRLLSDVG